MSELENKYQEAKAVSDRAEKLLHQYEDITVVKEYLAQLARTEAAKKVTEKAYKEVLNERIRNCEEKGHVLVTVDKVNGKRYCACIRCQTSETVARKIPYAKEIKTIEEQVQYEYLHRHQFHLNGVDTDVTCDVDTAHKLYERIIDEYGDIDNDTLKALFKDEFNNMSKEKEEESSSKQKNLMIQNAIHQQNNQ